MIRRVSLRRQWLALSIANGWTPLESRFLCRGAEWPGKRLGPFKWAPTVHPIRGRR